MDDVYRVLLVDDEADFSETLTERLEMRGLKVSIADNGSKALKILERTTFDAIVLDIAMPGIDGIATLKRLKGRNPDLQVIMLSGQATIPIAVEAMNIGAFDVMEKPGDVDELLDKIQRAAEAKHNLTEKRRMQEVEELLRKKGW